MQAAITWSPELHTVVRNLKKNLGAIHTDQLSAEEANAVNAVISKPTVNKLVRPLATWG